MFFAALFVIALASSVFLGREVFEDLERQRTASSDNVQWTLTQVEVEYLTYLNELDHFILVAESERSKTLDTLRTQFDIFYSRIDTLNASPLFRQLRQKPEFTNHLSDVLTYLDDAVPYIDNPDMLDGAAAQRLKQGADALQDAIRALSISGLSYFASLSDERRDNATRTLKRLVAITVGLVLMLAALAGYLIFVNRKVRQRGRALSQANERVRTVMATSLEAVIVSDVEGTVLEFNPAAEQIFQRSREDALGQSIGDLIVPEHLRDAHRDGMKRIRSRGNRNVVGKGRVQLEAMRADGEIFPVELAIESALNGNDEIFIGFVRDISKRVAAQTELITTRDKALAGEKAKDRFLTVMSHEIRTPLNGLLGNLSLLTRSNLDGEQKKLTRNMQISGQVLMNHVDSVLDIARFEAGKLSAVREKVNLNDLMQEIVNAQSVNAASKGNAIAWQWLGQPHPWVLTDAQRLRQILLNLVGNAIKFTDDGRISLEIECHPQSRDPETMDYEIRVIDTGIGISEDDQSRVFDDFETSDSTSGHNIEGTGLGLGIARRFISTLGGDIGVESEVGQGSVFWINLPMRRTTPSTKQETQKQAAALDAPLNVLVVEDNEINSEVMHRMLELDGHSVTLAENGKAGVDIAHKQHFDVILMDISMPIMDGPTATRHIRLGSGKCKETPIIAVSANVLPSAIDTFRSTGMSAFLGKPITVESLRHALSTILQGANGKVILVPAGNNSLHHLKAQLGDHKLNTLLATCRTEGDQFMDTLRDNDVSHANSIAAQAHKLAGSAGMFGFEDLRQALLSLENAISDSDENATQRAVLRCHETWANVRPTLMSQQTDT